MASERAASSRHETRPEDHHVVLALQAEIESLRAELAEVKRERTAIHEDRMRLGERVEAAESYAESLEEYGDAMAGVLEWLETRLNADQLRTVSLWQTARKATSDG